MNPKKINVNGLAICIENPKGSYKSFEIENDPVWKDYPLKGVTYPVDYGYIENYRSEDNQDLDVFVGTGESNGYMKIWRCDVPAETKFVA
jgi:inorganic pyrophosphatase